MEVVMEEEVVIEVEEMMGVMQVVVVEGVVAMQSIRVCQRKKLSRVSVIASCELNQRHRPSIPTTPVPKHLLHPLIFTPRVCF